MGAMDVVGEIMPEAASVAAVVTADFDLITLGDVGDDGGATRRENKAGRKGN